MSKKNFAGRYVSAFGTGTAVEDNMIARIDKRAKQAAKAIIHPIKGTKRRVFIREVQS